MTAYLISLALIGLVVIAVSEELLVSAEIIQFIPRPGARRRTNGFSDDCFPLCGAGSRHRSPSMQRQTSMPDRPAGKPSVAKPLVEIRADFQHLRRWRRSVEQAQSYTFKAVITVIVTGFVGAVWLGIKATLGK